MQPAVDNDISAALEQLEQRLGNRAGALQGDPRRNDPAGRVTVLEQQLGELLAGLPGGIVGAALDAAAAHGIARRSVALQPVQPMLLSAFDRICKNLLGVFTRRLGKLPPAAAEQRTQAHARLKRTARAAREQLQQRIDRQDDRAQESNQQRREQIRVATHAQRRAERRASARARSIWLALVLAVLAAMSWLALRKQLG